ncbi:MAG TPA: hypothetical protein VFV33_25650, partial [Gemmatimonadaceae bacterium]|nr:hypothetical protein [Gemmatimonadaceae bacterium]
LTGGQSPPVPRPYRLALSLGLAAVGVRLWLILGHLPRLFDTENMRAGFTLFSRGVMSDPFLVPTGPTAHVAPLYPALIAVSSHLAGDAENGLLLARSFIAIAFGAMVAAFPFIAEWLRFPRRAGWVAALLFLFPTPPVFMWIEVSGQHEAIVTGILFTFAVAATLGSILQGRVTTQRAILLGLLWAGATYSSPVAAPPLMTLLGGAWLLKLQPRRSLLRFGAALVASFTLAVTPWLVRNARTVGGFAFIRDNFWLELYVSNAADAGPDMRDNIRTTMRRHPFFNRSEAEQVSQVGEQRYNAARGAEARAWIRANPRRFVELTLWRIRYFFAPRLGVVFHPAFFIPTLLLSSIGLGIALMRGDRIVGLLAAIILTYAAPHFLVQASPRYSYPVLWILVLVAATVALNAWDWMARRLRSRPLGNATA